MRLSARHNPSRLRARLPWRRPILVAVLALAVSACAAEHRLMRPSADATFPALSGDADRYLEHREEWTRREPLGVKGEVVGTLEDPSLGADYLAFLARTQGLGEVRRDTYFETMWAVLYGLHGDRIPVRIILRFDRLFYSPQVLEPERWDFVLEDESGRRWQPIHVGDHEAAPAEPGKMAASFRLWFRTVQPGQRPMIDGRTRELTLHVGGVSGTAALRWKFKPAIPHG